MPDHPMSNLSREQQELWQRVNELWSLSLERNAEKIRCTLHPQYVGWDMTSSHWEGADFIVNIDNWERE